MRIRVRLNTTNAVLRTQKSTRNVRFTTQIRNATPNTAIMAVPIVVALAMSHISSQRLVSRFEAYRPNTLKMMCQITRKLTNKIRFPSFTRSSKNSASVNLPTR